MKLTNKPRLSMGRNLDHAYEVLPHDLIFFEILIRLPIKSIIRFKSVCKTWNYVISHDSDFANLYVRIHRQIQNNDMHPCYILHELKEDSNWRLLSLKLDPFQLDEFRNYSKDDDVSKTTPPCLVGSANGLLCFYDEKLSNVYTLWNPMTGARSLIRGPLLLHSCKILCQGFGYVPSSWHEYKIVIFCEYRSIGGDVGSNIAYRFSSRTMQWKPLDLDLDMLALGRSKKPAVQVGETLHWALSNPHDVIALAFNLTNDSIHSVPLPDPLHDQTYRRRINMQSVIVSVIRQRLCMSWFLSSQVPYGRDCTEVWVLEQYGEPESWKMFLNIQDFEGYKFRSLLDAKDNTGRVLLIRDGCYDLIDHRAVVEARSYRHCLEAVVEYTPSLESPCSPKETPRRLTGMKRKTAH